MLDRSYQFVFLAAITFLGFANCNPVACQQPRSPLVDSHKQFLKLKGNSEFNVEWIQLGPVVNSARVEAVQADPSRPGTLYAAFGSGGLWKTTNNGITWRSIFDNQASYGIGDIALAPSNPDVIYVGSGESLKKARNFTIPGTGIYRSVDGGENWEHLGLNDSWHIGEIAVHPRNPDVVLVAVLGHFWSTNPNRGLYLTKNGGKTWKQVIHIDDKTGANDVVWCDTNPNYAYASLWENNPDVAGKNSAIYRSADGGETWTKCSKGLPSGNQIGRIGLAVSSSNPKKVYALVDNREFSESAAAQIYRSVDGGESWTRTHKADQKFLSRIGWYFCDIYLNPKNDEEVFALGVRLAHSKDGGKTFSFIGGQVAHVNRSAASGLHLDQCELWIHPNHPEHLVLGNDGGLYQSFDKGRSWKHFNNIPAGEFYDIEIDQRTPYRIFAGAQDDATVFGPPKEFDPNSQADLWEYLWIDPWNGGDGCVTLVDPNDVNTVYYSAQEGAIRRKDMRTGRSKGIRPRLPRELRQKNENAKMRFNFVAPMILSPHDSNQIYVGGNYLFSSPDRGESWKVISPDFSEEKSDRGSVGLSTVSESPLKKGLLLAGTDRGNFWVSEDGGAKWDDRTNDLPNGYIRCIVPSCHAQSRVYVAMSGLNYDDFRAQLYCSNDLGKTWTPIMQSLPNEPVNVVAESPRHPNVLFAGTFRGVFISLDRGNSWSLLGKNIAPCSIGDLAIHKAENELVVGTHGRGLYKLNLDPIDQVIKAELTATKKNKLLPAPIAFRPYLSNIRPTLSFRRPEKSTFSFWLHKRQKISLQFFPRKNEANEISEIDKPFFEVELNGQKGLNQFRWDLQTKTNESNNPYFTRYREYLPNGNYWLRMVSEDQKTQKVPFVVKDQEK